LQQPDELFTVNTANQWLQQATTRPVPKMLFGKFWFEGELCILFADSNLGKSILAEQIGNSINTGVRMYPFWVESHPQPILYCDFELTDRQFESRYSDNYHDHYAFRDDFYRAELNPDSERLNDDQIEQAAKLKLEGKTLREIGKAMGISFQKVDRLLKASAAKS
jgi:hypothetical protein